MPLTTWLLRKRTVNGPIWQHTRRTIIIFHASFQFHVESVISRVIFFLAANIIDYPIKVSFTKGMYAVTCLPAKINIKVVISGIGGSSLDLAHEIANSNTRRNGRHKVDVIHRTIERIDKCAQLALLVDDSRKKDRFDFRCNQR